MNLKIQNVIPKVIKTEIEILKKRGSKIKVKKNKIQIIGNKKIKNIKKLKHPLIQAFQQIASSNNGFIV